MRHAFLAAGFVFLGLVRPAWLQAALAALGVLLAAWLYTRPSRERP